MNLFHRISRSCVAPAGTAAGITWHNADQSDFHRRAAGRWISDITVGPHACASLVRQYGNGAVQVVSLTNDETHWIDLGGSAGVDFRAGRI